MLLCAGISLNGCVFAAFFRPISAYNASVPLERHEPSGELGRLVNKISPVHSETKSEEINVRKEGNTESDGHDRGKDYRSMIESKNDNIINGEIEFERNQNDILNKHDKRIVTDASKWSLHLLRDARFYLFLVAESLWTIGFTVFQTTYLDNAVNNGVRADKAVVLLSVAGIASTLAALLLAVVGNCFDSMLVYCTAVIVLGTGLVNVPLMGTFGWYAFCAAIYGTGWGVVLGINPVVMVEMFGTEHIANAFGYIKFIQGFVSLASPPVMGEWKMSSFSQ